MARDLLGGDDLGQSLIRTAQRLAGALALPWAAIVLAPFEGDDRGIVVALRDQGQRIGALVLPREVPELTLRLTSDRIVPALERLVAAALERRRLRRSDSVKTAMLRSVSHDLRSHLMAIIAAAQGLDATAIADADRHELAAVVDEGAARIARLVDGLLDLERLDAGAAEPQRSWCALDEVLEAALGDFGLPAATFSIGVGDDLPLVHADSAQLRTSFGNLLANAARYSQGQPVLVDAHRHGDHISIRIADRGPGVPSDARGRVFEAFQREGSDPTGHAGRGLGLAIARGFVEANGGRIAIESTADGGATFVVQLPLPTPELQRTTLPAAG